MNVRKKLKLITVFVCLIGLCLFIHMGCAKNTDNNSGSSASASEEITDIPKTDITESQAKEAAEGIRKQAELTLSAAETVYVFAYPDMLQIYGADVDAMDAETYFLNYAKMLKEGRTLMPDDELMIESMNSIGLNAQEGTFNIEAYSAGMGKELSEVPSAMQKLIKDYDNEIQGDNEYMQKAHEAYEEFEG